MLGTIKITDFGKRHFDPKFGGTKITTLTPEQIEEYLMSQLKPGSNIIAKVMDGYAPFCKLVAVKNITDARVGTMPIDMANYQYLRHGYSARTPDELPILTRWFELPLPAPKAEYLIFILYSKEQVEKEANKNGGNFVFEADWGVVAILGQTHNEEEPMAPVTMMRNALGIEEGGSGVPINREKYLASVEFWKRHAIVKS